MTTESPEQLPEEEATGSLGIIVFDEDDDLFSFDELSSPVPAGGMVEEAADQPADQWLLAEGQAEEWAVRSEDPSLDEPLGQWAADEAPSYEPVPHELDAMSGAPAPQAPEFNAQGIDESPASVEQDSPELEAILTDLDATLPDLGAPLPPSDPEAMPDDSFLDPVAQPQDALPEEEWLPEEEAAYELPGEEPRAQASFGSLLRTGALVAALTFFNLTLVGIVLRSQRTVRLAAGRPGSDRDRRRGDRRRAICPGAHASVLAARRGGSPGSGRALGSRGARELLDRRSLAERSGCDPLSGCPKQSG
jgi:hypothetical protein